MARYKNPKVTVDGVIMDKEKVVLIKRKNQPYKNKWALPGGYVEYGESTEQAIAREVKEETGIEIEIERLVGVYSDPNRDPRGHTISIVYLCKPKCEKLEGGDDAKEAKWFPLGSLPPQLAFDHGKILSDAIKLHKKRGENK